MLVRLQLEAGPIPVAGGDGAQKSYSFFPRGPLQATARNAPCNLKNGSSMVLMGRILHDSYLEGQGDLASRFIMGIIRAFCGL